MIITDGAASALAGIVSDPFMWYGGEGMMYVWGNLGDGVLYIEHTPDKDNPNLWYFLEFTEIFEPTAVRFSLPHGVYCRIVLRNNQQAVTGLNVKVY